MLVYDIVLRMGKQRVSMTAAELQAAGRAVRLTGGPRWPAAGVFRVGTEGIPDPVLGRACLGRGVGGKSRSPRSLQLRPREIFAVLCGVENGFFGWNNAGNAEIFGVDE
jgi:hypothetical protein